MSVLEFRDDGTWDTKVFNAHGMGCNAVSWAAATAPVSLISSQAHSAGNIKRLASAGCDNLIKIWIFEYVPSLLPTGSDLGSQERNTWIEEETLQGHTDWVRDVAFAPSIGMSKTYLASASQVHRF